MKLSKETLETAWQSLNERSLSLANIKIHGLTPAIRKAAEEDYDKTHKAWGEIEKLILESK